MITGIGCDILEIKHFKDIFEKFPSFLNKVYSKKEIEEYHKRKDDIKYLASRFCAKEAIFKALTKYEYDFNTIEIINDTNNTPIVNFLNGDKHKIFVSISYENDYVLAYAILSTI